MNDKEPKYTRAKPMPPHRFVERELIFQLVSGLHARGWEPFKLQGDSLIERVKTTNASLQALQRRSWEAFEAVDTALLWFRKGEATNWVKLVGGNGPDVISDYGHTPAFKEVIDGVYLR